MRVTCDVSVHELFLSRSTINPSSLPTAADLEYFWDNLEEIDCLAVGSLPTELSDYTTASAGIEEALPLLLTAFCDDRISLEYITSRLYDNPRRIFDLPEQADTYIEVAIDRKRSPSRTSSQHLGSETNSISKKDICGYVHRVVIRGDTVYMDGAFFGEAVGRDVSGSVRIASRAAAPSPSLLTQVPWTIFLRDTALSKYKDLADEMDNKEHDLKHKKTTPASSQESGLMNKYISNHLPRVISTSVTKSSFYRKHILSVHQFVRSDLHTLFGVAEEMRTLVEKQGKINILNGKVMCSAFWEPSTRTSCSFEAAMNRLGGDVVSINQITSSIAKGETISDTVRSLACYGDVVVMRHPEPGSVSLATKFSPVPII
ncbi:hypothetical protein BASA81_007615, partial [Batrachochytrium salamandrivorans]